MTAVTADTWSSQAACRGSHVHSFMSPATESVDVRRQREAEAKRICEQCRVQPECLADALRVREPLGIWGGLTESERRPLLDRQ